MSDDIIVVCSGCKKLRISDYTWVEIDLPDGNLISHTICPECIPKLYPEVAEEVLKKLRERQQFKNRLQEEPEWQKTRKLLNPDGEAGE